ncbi:hypothetical protein HNO88_002995 [Novosphingobium chloroacetimidivorans]|uniref:Uncharacterized protein n=1 Tax=Novosphingobium chloroacetimidivorans TaxID=1428314 RepID=A0A7W7KBX8_9SPHN|nr:hypothetical protein [Novosphingobium chloroacetimidivorans]MBB4859666.1 hypothetical protein [Novosphingobium chloroacetimidivorans]
MSRAREAIPVAELLDEVEVFVIDHCQRGGEQDEPLPFDQQPKHVQAAIALAAALKELPE